MSAVIRFFRGVTTLRVTGAIPEDCLDRLSAGNVPFWHVTREDDFTFTLRIWRRDASRAAALAQRAQCDCRIVSRTGLAQRLGALRCRVAIALCFAAILAALCILPQFVWTLEVIGCEELHPQQILRALESIGVGFGTWGPSIDIQTVKNHMLALLPELEWIAVNRSGGRATVLVHERVATPLLTQRREAGNIVASRTGIITQMEVYSGDAVAQTGQTVLRGELLVTGCLERTTGIHYTHAMAEIYARTWHEVTALAPRAQQTKTYTGEEKTQYALILGKSRINFYANSGISGAKYDKMTEAISLTLPGGVTLPITLLKITTRAYTTADASGDPDAARQALDDAVQSYVTSSLVGGSITEYRSEFQGDGACYRLDAVAECSEQIALEQPLLPGKEDAEDGENH